jgi:hypothetical protein
MTQQMPVGNAGGLAQNDYINIEAFISPIQRSPRVAKQPNLERDRERSHAYRRLALVDRVFDFVESFAFGFAELEGVPSEAEGTHPVVACRAKPDVLLSLGVPTIDSGQVTEPTRAARTVALG